MINGLVNGIRKDELVLMNIIFLVFSHYSRCFIGKRPKFFKSSEVVRRALISGFPIGYLRAGLALSHTCRLGDCTRETLK